MLNDQKKVTTNKRLLSTDVLNGAMMVILVYYKFFSNPSMPCREGIVDQNLDPE